MPRLFRNLAAVVLAVGFACATACWAQQAGNTDLPLVWVLSTGGTIAGAGASSTNVQEYKGGTILGEDLVKAVPEINQFANVKVQQITNVGSPRLKLEDLLKLAKGLSINKSVNWASPSGEANGFGAARSYSSTRHGKRGGRGSPHPSERPRSSLPSDISFRPTPRAL